MGRGVEVASQLVKSLALLAQLREITVAQKANSRGWRIKENFGATAGKLLRDSYIYIYIYLMHGIQRALGRAQTTSVFERNST